MTALIPGTWSFTPIRLEICGFGCRSVAPGGSKVPQKVSPGLPFALDIFVCSLVPGLFELFGLKPWLHCLATRLTPPDVCSAY